MYGIRQSLLGVAWRFPGMKQVVNAFRYRNSVAVKDLGSKNIINYRGASLRSVSINIYGNENRIEIQEGSILNGVKFLIWGNGHSISIGRRCRFNRGGSIWFEDAGGKLLIGDGTTFEDVHLAVTEPGSNITIGKDCMFAYEIDVRTGDSHSIFDNATNERCNYAMDVSIGDHVWVATRCAILKGVIIPDDCIVATGSIVTSAFHQKGAILAGNPARVVKDGIRWSRERTYKNR
jgi:acetyltransferase-like isoleucine patch superfamily enzyme